MRSGAVGGAAIGRPHVTTRASARPWKRAEPAQEQEDVHHEDEQRERREQERPAVAARSLVREEEEGLSGDRKAHLFTEIAAHRGHPPAELREGHEAPRELGPAHRALEILD